MKKFSIAAAVVATLVAAPAVQAAEVALKGISAWPKTFPLTPDFLRFIEEANKRDISLWAGRVCRRALHRMRPDHPRAPDSFPGLATYLPGLMSR